MQSLLAEEGSFRKGLAVQELSVGPLDAEEATELAVSLMRYPDRPMAELIAFESEGSPFFVTELVRATLGDKNQPKDRDPDAMPDTVRIPRLGGVIGARLDRLTPAARTMLSVISVAGRPIGQGIAMRATGLQSEAAGALGVLRSERLVRTRGARANDSAEAYHDRIREAVVASLSEQQLKHHHRQLGLALEATPDADVEALERHFRECGDRPRARRYALSAAERASRALAFERAASFCRSALEADPVAADRWQVEAKLAEALTNAGRGGQAWKIYQAAATRAPKDDALELQRLAGEHACRTGHVDEGMRIFRHVTKEIGIRMAVHPLEALGSLLARRGVVRLRGIGYKARAPEEVSIEQRQRIDACYSLSVGLGFVDPIQGADFQTRMLLEALSAGDVPRIAIALALESCYTATQGASIEARTRRLIDAAEVIAKRTELPKALAIVEVSRAFYNVFVGRWRVGLNHAERGERMLREKCTNVSHEIATAQIFGLWSLFNLGEIKELTQRYPEHVRHHLERGDQFAAGSKQSLIGHIHHLALDSPTQARAEVQAGMKGWSDRGFHVQHWYELKAMTHIDFYAGDDEGAYDRVQRTWPAMQRSLIRRVVSIRSDSLYLRSRAWLRRASKKWFKGSLLRQVEKDAEALESSGLRNTPGWAHSLRASAAAMRGDRTTAQRRFAHAAQVFDAADMVLFAAGARFRQGQLTSSKEGVRLMDEAEQLLSERGVARPERFIDILIPTVG